MGLFLVGVVASLYLSGIFEFNQENLNKSIQISNPLQMYKIDSTCELAFAIQTNHETGYNGALHLDKTRFENDLKEISQEKQKMLEEHDSLWGYTAEGKQAIANIWEKLYELQIDNIMTYNSIHPKLRDSVKSVVENMFQAQPKSTEEQITAMNVIFLIQSEPYKEDPECGKKFHERFGNETFKMLKQIFGEDRATIEYDKIKKIIYGN